LANQNQVLQALSSEGGLVITENLATSVGTTQDTIRALCSKLKSKGYVDGSTKEGWTITSDGREVLERGLKIPTTPEDVGADTESKFKYYGKLAGVDPDRILATTEAILTGDPENLEHVWEVMTQMDIAMPNRRRWFNSWRYYLNQGIPAELKEKVFGSPDDEKGETLPLSAKERGKDYIIVDEEPIRVGAGLGDYGLQDAKDILGIRALRSRFAGVGQGGSPPAGSEKVSELITALAPFINKSSDPEMLKETLADKLALQRQEILSHMPQQGPQPKSFGEEITGFAAALSSLKEAGPMLKSILGLPESSGNPSTGLPVQIKGPDGSPIVMDLGQVIDWRRFQNDERRADERHGALVGLAQTVRENFGDGISALKAAAEDVKGTSKSKTAESPPQQPQVFECGDCHTTFGAPAEWAGEPIICPNPKCGRQYTKEELMG